MLREGGASPFKPHAGAAVNQNRQTCLIADSQPLRVCVVLTGARSPAAIKVVAADAQAQMLATCRSGRSGSSTILVIDAGGSRCQQDASAEQVQVGAAIHLAFQHLEYASCSDPAGSSRTQSARAAPSCAPSPGHKPSPKPPPSQPPPPRRTPSNSTPQAGQRPAGAGADPRHASCPEPVSLPALRSSE